MILLFGILALIFACSTGFFAYKYSEERRLTEAQEMVIEEYSEHTKLLQQRNSREQRDFLTQLRNQANFTRTLEKFHLENEERLVDELHRAHGIVEFLLDKRVQQDTTIQRDKARHLFVV